MATNETILGLTVEQLEKMSDEELQKHYAEMLRVVPIPEKRQRQTEVIDLESAGNGAPVKRRKAGKSKKEELMEQMKALQQQYGFPSAEGMPSKL